MLGRLRRRRPLTPAAQRAAALAPPHPRLPWREASIAVVDVETTGLEPARDEVIQFGVVRIVGGAIPAAAAVEGLIRPTTMPARGNVEIHRIRPADLAAAPLLPDAAEPLIDALAGCVVAAHAAHVERAFLGPLLAASGAVLHRPLIDTADLWRLVALHEGRADPGLVGLARLAAALGLPADSQHHALGDALTTAQCLLALASRLERLRAGEPLTVGDLARARRRLDAHRAVGVRGGS